MTVRSWRVHGVTVRLDSDLPAPLAEPLLARFPVASQEARAEELSVELRLDPRPEAHAELAAPPIFFHGALRAFEVPGAVELRQEGVLLRVASDGRSIRGRVRPTVDPHDFANVALLVALTLALRPRTLFHLHAAACVVPGLGGLLIPGAAGSGKSSLSLALLAAGAGWLGDDAVLVARRDGGPAVLGLPKPFHVADRTARAYPELAGLLEPCGAAGKRALDPRLAFPGRELELLAAPAAVLLPAIADAEHTVVEGISSAEALGALIESSAMLAVDGMPGVPEQLDLLRALANAPVRARVLLGRDLLEAPRRTAAALTGTLRGLAARTS
jgi:hypothetical protein